MNFNNQTVVETYIDGKQAKKDLADLRKRAEELRGAYDKAITDKDTRAAGKYASELKKVGAQMKNLERKHFDVNKVLDNLSSASVPALNKALQRLNAEIKGGNVKRGSKEWEVLQSRIRRVKEEIAKVNAEQRLQPDVVARSGQMWQRYGGYIAGAATALVGFLALMNKYRSEKNTMEDNAANLEALTGLSEQSVEWLQKQAETLSSTVTEGNIRIRESAGEILNAYTVVGSNKPEVLGNKEDLYKLTKYSLILKTASKDIKSTEEAAGALTLALNQFGEGADKAERFSNALSASAQKGAANVAAQTAALKNSGVALKGANVSFEESLGLIQTLAEKGIKNEEAGTGLKKLMLILQTGADATNPRIVGLTQALENLQKQQLSAAEMKKRFGEEGYTVSKVLIDNVRSVREYTRAVEGSASALDMAATNSKTQAARMAQARNEIKLSGIALVEDLEPLLKLSTLGLSYTLKLFPPLIAFFKRYGAGIVTVTVALAANNAALKLSAALSQKNVLAKGKEIVVTRAKAAADRLSTAFVYAQAASYDILDGKIRRATKTLGVSPWFLVAAGIGAAGYALYRYTVNSDSAARSAKMINEVLKETAERTAREKTELEILLATAKNDRISKEQRAEAVKKLNELSPEYLGNLSLENIRTEKAAESIEAYTRELEKNARAKAASSKMAEAETRILENEIQIAEHMKAFEDSQKRGGETKDYRRRKAEALRAENKELQKQKEVLMSLIQTEKVKESPKTDIGGELIAANARLRELRENHARLIAELDKKPLNDNSLNYIYKANIENVIKDIAAQEETVRELEKKNKEARNEEANKAAKLSEEELKKRFEKEEKSLALGYDKRLLLFKKALLYGEITQVSFNRRSEELNIERLQATKALYKKYGKDTAQTELQLADAYLKIIEDKRKPEAALFESPSLKEEEPEEDSRLNSLLSVFRDSTRGQLAINQAMYDAGLIHFEEYQKKKTELEKKGAEEREKLAREERESRIKKETEIAEAVGAMAQYGANIVRGIVDAQTSALDARYAKEIRLAGDNAEEKARLEEELEEEKKAIKKKYADVQFAMDIASIAANTSVAAMKAWSQGGVFAAPMVALIVGQGIVQAAQANQQREAVKNLWTGGYTGPGIWNEPRGIVHPDEFVANRFAVRNPEVNRVFSLIDHAQRNNYVSRLSGRDITDLFVEEKTRGIVPKHSPTESPQPFSRMPAASVSDDPELKRVLRKLTGLLSSPIPAIVRLHGGGGLDEASRLNDRIKNNSKRKSND